MSWFQLDPPSTAARARAANDPGIPSLASSLWRGVVGFTIVSVAGFAPWAVGGHWLYPRIGEAGLYAVCALVFIGLSGLLLHRLIIGPGSLSRFYKLFTVSFTAYAVVWIAGWMALRGHAGSLTGLFAGNLVLGWMLTRAFDARSQFAGVVASLFLLNTAGYFLGGWIEGAIVGTKHLTLLGLSRPSTVTLAMLLWGVAYGLGFGAGWGIAFHLCQTETRRLLAEPPR